MTKRDGVTSYFAADPSEIRLSVSAVVWGGAAGREILFMQRSDNGLWGLPGGYVEAGETVEAAAAREVAEETGWRIEVGRLVGVYSDPSRQVIAYPSGDRVHAVNLCFEARALECGEVTTPQETLRVAFHAPDAWPEPLVPIHEIRIVDVLAGDRAVRVR